MKHLVLILGFLLIASNIGLGDESLNKGDKPFLNEKTVNHHILNSTETTNHNIAKQTSQSNNKDTFSFNNQNNVHNSRDDIQNDASGTIDTREIELPIAQRSSTTLGLLTSSNNPGVSSNSQKFNNESTIPFQVDVWNLDKRNDSTVLNANGLFNNSFHMEGTYRITNPASATDHPRLFHQNRHVELGSVAFDNGFSQNLLSSIMTMPIKVLDIGTLMTEK